MMTLHLTLGNDAWMRANFQALRAILQPHWVRQDRDEIFRLGFQLKLLGVEWHSNDELVKTLTFLRRVRVMESDMRGWPPEIWVRRHA